MSTLHEAARLEIWTQRLAEIADAMGTVLRRSAVSPNIRERADFSCALFDANGQTLAEAPHVPVHLGSMGLAVRAVMANVSLAPGAVGIVNDPFAGGTHLPDLTLVEAVHLPEILGGGVIAHIACRAHHADVGGSSPGSMPVAARAAAGTVPAVADVPPAVGPRYPQAKADGVVYRELSLADEGVCIAAQLLDGAVVDRVAAASRAPDERRADLAAQRAALRHGRDALVSLVRAEGVTTVVDAFSSLQAYGARLMRGVLWSLPPGVYPFADSLDDDGAGHDDLALRVVITLSPEGAVVDLEESADETSGSLNTVRAVTEAAVAYAFRCLLPAGAPTCAGLLAPIEILTRPGSLCHAKAPRAVSAGNVETSQRIVDVVLGALAQAAPDRIPAASAGTMSNLLIGDDSRAYYETIAGGAGAGPHGHGASAIQTHMTNTKNTPIESLEATMPLRITQYAVRRATGGGGTSNGGDGVVRELELLQPLTVTLVGERRRRPPYGLLGGGPGIVGIDSVTRDGVTRRVPAKISFEGRTGDVIRIETPGGGGHGDTRRAGFWAAILSGAPLSRTDLGLAPEEPEG